MKQLKYFIEDTDWLFPIAFTVIILIFMVTQNVVAVLQVRPEEAPELIKKQWVSTLEWSVIVFIATTYLQVGINYWLVQHGYDID